MVTPKVLGDGVKDITEQGRGEANIRHQCVFGLAMGEETKREEAKQRAVGIACQDIDGIDERSGIDLSEQKDEQHEETTHGDVCPLSKRLILRLSADIHAETGSQRGKGRVGTGERGCHNTEDE